jgi:N-acetylneuraminic acid mutarotase
MGGSLSGTRYATVEEYDPASNTWAARAPLPTARGWLTSATLKGKVYALGGFDTTYSTTVERYDPGTNAWSAVPSLPGPLRETAAVAFGGKTYVVAGRSSGYGYSKSVYAYDPETNTWTTGTGLPSERFANSGLVLRNRILCIGGKVDPTTTIKTVDGLQPHRGGWSGMPPVSVARSSASAAVVRGRAYVIGGGSVAGVNEEGILRAVPLLQDRPDLATPASAASAVLLGGRVHVMGGRTSSAAAGTTHVACPFIEDLPASGTFDISREWSARASLGAARRSAGAVAYGGKAYLAGGLNASGTAVTTFESYDPSGNSWTNLTALPRARGAGGGVVIGTKLYVFGGVTTGGAKTGTVDVYDLQNSTWGTGPYASMNTARSHFGFAVDPDSDQIYVFGGEIAGGSPSASVEVYDPRADGWTVLGAMPWALEGCLGLFEGGTVKLFGGEDVNGRTSTRIREYDVGLDAWRIVEDRALPYPARDLFGAVAIHSWTHRGASQSDEFCFLGGGFDGSSYHEGVFRFLMR